MQWVGIAAAGGLCFLLLNASRDYTFSLVWRALHGHAAERLRPLRKAAFSMAFGSSTGQAAAAPASIGAFALVSPSPPLPPLGRPVKMALELGAGMGDCVAELCAAAAAASGGAPLDRLLLVEPNVHFHAALRRAAASVPAPTEVALLACGGESLSAVADASVDLAFSHLVLCSAPPQPVLAELRRVLRPGGRLVCVEHVRGPPAAWLQYVLTLSGIWGFVGGGCCLTRDTAAELAAAGPWQRLEVQSVEVSGLPAFMRPHIIAVAVR